MKTPFKKFTDVDNMLPNKIANTAKNTLKALS